MSMYNMVFGVNENAPACLHMIGLDIGLIPRFRDAWLTWRDESETEPAINVYTRTGGNNREGYADGNAYLRGNAFFLADRDDTFDSTFANWIFRVPEHRIEEVTEFLRKHGAHPTSEDQWQAAIKLMGNDGP